MKKEWFSESRIIVNWRRLSKKCTWPFRL